MPRLPEELLPRKIAIESGLIFLGWLALSGGNDILAGKKPMLLEQPGLLLMMLPLTVAAVVAFNAVAVMWRVAIDKVSACEQAAAGQTPDEEADDLRQGPPRHLSI